MAAERFDYAVVGAGIAGASVAAELAEAAAGKVRVALLERETQPGYHSTGRSAALFTCTYGPAGVRALARASESFFRETRGPAGNPLLSPRGVLFLAREDQAHLLPRLAAEMAGALVPVMPAAARDMLPLLREGYLSAALHDPAACDIDVDALHQLYLRRLRAAGGAVLLRAEVTGLARAGQGWHLATAQGELVAGCVVNAAGAWADEVAALAGVAPLGLVPRRRTAALVSLPRGTVPDAWPMAVDAEERFYAKPDAGKLLISPADATPVPPGDVQPEELDVAICVDRIETAFDLSVRRIDHRWAGLRSFVADGEPVAGFAADAPGFFWLAGQGGYGIQTAPALARGAAALLLGRDLPDGLRVQGLEAALLSPARASLAAA